MTTHPEPQSLEEARTLILQAAANPPPAPEPKKDAGGDRSDARVTEIPGVDDQDEDENLPLYTDDRGDILQQLQELADEIYAEDSDALPILAYPPKQELQTLEEGESLRRRRRIVTTFFDEIAKANVEMISTLLHMALVTTETTNEAGRTPLLAAVDAGKSSSVKSLLEAGASINAYGITETVTVRSRTSAVPWEEHTYRTPLQLAAELGNLALVKLLMVRGADDSLIAPDGQLALRLAATHGHREVVDFLPMRRGGEFTRWKAKHKTAMRRVKKAMFGIYSFVILIVWGIPALFIYYLPKHVIVKPAISFFTWLFEHGSEIPGKIWKFMKEVGAALMKVPPAIWKCVKAIPGCLWDVICGIAKLLSRVASNTWQLMIRIPGCIWNAVKAVGSAIVSMFSTFFSFVHTLMAGIIGFFRRITLADVGRAFVSCLRAVFVELPKKLWEWTCALGLGFVKAVKAVFGWFGECILFIGRCWWKFITYVPRKIGEVIAACGSSIKNAVKEVMVWFNPKRV